ncbi:MAG TPA: amidohydrolase family protein [Mycobacteriales bacterium]|nr:amidohydrolase family protein [Mycobacteriales bacterium]
MDLRFRNAKGETGSAAAADYARGPHWPDGDLVDCDVHIRVRSLPTLMPYLPERWQAYITESGVGNLEPNTHPPGAPTSLRPGLEPRDGESDLDAMRRLLLDPWQTHRAVLGCEYGIDAVRNDDWAAAMGRAVNEWQAAEWLDPEPRLRGSILVPIQNVELAVAEIDRLGDDPRFVQVLLPVRAPEPLGRRRFWPIYEAAQRHGLVVGIHAGGSSGNPISAVGWPTYYLEDYVDLAQVFQSQLMSLVSEGVFAKFPELTVAFIESGFTWLPALMWRFDKNWKGLRREVPWVDRPPSEIIRERVRITAQPLDGDPAFLRDIIEQIDCPQMLLFATDYPHWQFDGGALPDGLDEALLRRILSVNATETYRL